MNILDGGQDLSLTTFLVSPQQLKAKLGEDVHIPCPTTGTGQLSLNMGGELLLDCHMIEMMFCQMEP